MFVRNVPDTCDERRLKQEFEGFGTVRETAIVRNRDGSSKGYGFVVFEDPEALMKAASQAQRVIDGKIIRNSSCFPASAVHFLRRRRF